MLSDLAMHPAHVPLCIAMLLFSAANLSSANRSSEAWKSAVFITRAGITLFMGAKGASAVVQFTLLTPADELAALQVAYFNGTADVPELFASSTLFFCLFLVWDSITDCMVLKGGSLDFDALLHHGITLAYTVASWYFGLWFEWHVCIVHELAGLGFNGLALIKQNPSVNFHWTGSCCGIQMWGSDPGQTRQFRKRSWWIYAWMPIVQLVRMVVDLWCLYRSAVHYRGVLRVIGIVVSIAVSFCLSSLFSFPCIFFCFTLAFILLFTMISGYACLHRFRLFDLLSW
jgi:hypothetical protein